MTNWLFGGIAGLIFIIIAILLVIAVYVPQARKLILKLIGCFAVVLFVGGSAYCGIQVDSYLNAQGGIYGYITGLLDINTATQEEEDALKFKLNNIVLTQDSDNEYSALIYPNNLITLEEDINYTIYVNEAPLNPIDSASGYIVADYTYNFYNDDMTLALEDTLRFNLTFDDYVTTFKLTTYGGQTAVDYWNNYFARNKLTIEIKELNFKLDNNINIVEGDISNFYFVNYFVDSESFMTQVYQSGSEIVFLNAPQKQGFSFVNWKNSEGKVVKKGYQVKTDLNLYAEYIEVEYLSQFTFDGNRLVSYTGIDSVVEVPMSYSISSDGRYIEGTDYIVSTIDSDCFYNLDTLTKIILPSSVTHLEDHVARNCKNLTEVEIKNSLAVIKMSGYETWGFFWNCAIGTSLKVYVPETLYQAYTETHLWGGYSYDIFINN